MNATVIKYEIPSGSTLRKGVPSDQPVLALRALQSHFQNRPDVRQAYLGLMEVIPPGQEGHFTYVVGIVTDPRHSLQEEDLMAQVLTGTTMGRWPILIVPYGPDYFTSQATRFYERKGPELSVPAGSLMRLVRLVRKRLSFKKPSEQETAASAARPVENPVLEAAMLLHRSAPSEKTVNDVGRALRAATFLAPLKKEGLQWSTKGESTFIDPGSTIGFMTAQTTDGKTYLPVFTSWSEVRRWADDDVHAFVQPASEVWFRALSGPTPHGVVINPATMPWTLEPTHIKDLIEDLKVP